jgi:hypothetical protein
MFKRHVTRYSFGLVCLVLLSLLMVACGTPTTTTTTTTTQPKPTAKPSPTPAVNLTAYTGSGYTIGYPAGWKVANSNQQVQIADAAQDNVIIETKTGTSSISSTTSTSIVQFTLAGLKTVEKNYKEVTVPSKTTIGGTSWAQGAAAMDDAKSGSIQFVVLVTQSPKHPGQYFIIIYGTTVKTFATVNTADFQPMLNSFKFQ